MSRQADTPVRIATIVSDMVPSVPPGRRERNKQAKEVAIRNAARQLFVEKGYDATTLREIAEMAQVGFGTVFAYATDKSGLLAMIFVEQLKMLPPLFESGDGDAPLLDQLVAGLGRLYTFWATVPTLSRHALQQMEFYSANPHMDIILKRRGQARTELAVWIAAMMRAGRIDPAADIEAAADTLFAIYTSTVRQWAADRPHDVAYGLAQLARLMALPMRALAA